MLKLTRIKKSRNSWKEKASNRSDQLREGRKLKKKQSAKIKELKAENKELKETLNGKKK